MTNILKFSFAICIYLLFLVGCTTPSAHKLPYSKELVEAEQLMQKGQPKQAAQLYQQLADNPSKHQNQFRILAAESLIQSGNPGAAKIYADAINPASLNPQQKYHLSLIYAQLSLNKGDAEQALDRLAQIPANQLDLDNKINYRKARAFAYSLTGNLLRSANERIKLGALLQNTQQLYENNAAILETLSILSPQALETARQTAPYELNGWIKLVMILRKQSYSAAELNAAIEHWRKAFAKHAANTAFLDQYLAKPQPAFTRPNAIAVLLPESGPYAQAAQAIREGIMAAYYHEQDVANKPDIRFFDTQSGHVFTLYEQAITEGAELIIGPLSKQKISELISTSELSIPVLALNTIPDVYQPRLFQFGLNPIDEVQQITSKAWFDGHQKALLLVPESLLGQRIADYFSTAWEANDGMLLETQTFNPKDSDFSDPIKKLLNLDESQHRYEMLQQLIPGIHYTPRRRHDVDVIFLSANPRASRLINPQLHFYRATHIPVYATSYLYNGRPDPAQDIDLNDITFCDIPWLYNNAYQGDLNIDALQDSWQQFPSIYLRLIAMGIDAYNLVPHLQKLHTFQYSGTTGNLLLTDKNRIRRHLICAKFVAGIPQIISPDESPLNTFESIAKPLKTSVHGNTPE